MRALSELSELSELLDDQAAVPPPAVFE